MTTRNTERTREICRLYREGVKVPQIAARFGVLNPAIYKQLRAGGVLPPYRPSLRGGQGRPKGGGTPGYTAQRLARSAGAVAGREGRQPPPPGALVDRDPCSRCGTRGDLPCAHRPSSSGLSRADLLAELVAEGATITEAGRAMGMAQQRASALWQRIVRQMGEQAV